MRNIITERIKELEESINDCNCGLGIYKGIPFTISERKGVIELMNNTLELNRRLLSCRGLK